MEITGTVNGIRREQDVASSHVVYILDGMREIHDYGALHVNYCNPQIGDRVRVEGYRTPSGQDCARRIEVLPGGSALA